MCYGGDRLPSKDELANTTRIGSSGAENTVVAELALRLAETEARLAQARAREAELSRQLEEMKRYLCVMEILETYLKRRFLEQQQHVSRILSPVSKRQHL